MKLDTQTLTYILDERYAANEITREQYISALEDIVLVTRRQNKGL